MGEWDWVPLADVITLQRGHDLPETARRPGSVPVLGSFGLTGTHDEAKYQGPGVSIGRSGASIGVATFTPEDYWPLNTVLFVRDFKGNDPKWVYYLLKMLDFSGYNSGSAQPSLNRNYIARMAVPRPPLDEQELIGALLGGFERQDRIKPATGIDCGGNARVRSGNTGRTLRSSGRHCRGVTSNDRPDGFGG